MRLVYYIFLSRYHVELLPNFRHIRHAMLWICSVRVRENLSFFSSFFREASACSGDGRVRVLPISLHTIDLDQFIFVGY